MVKCSQCGNEVKVATNYNSKEMICDECNARMQRNLWNMGLFFGFGRVVIWGAIVFILKQIKKLFMFIFKKGKLKNQR